MAFGGRAGDVPRDLRVGPTSASAAAHGGRRGRARTEVPGAGGRTRGRRGHSLHPGGRSRCAYDQRARTRASMPASRRACGRLNQASSPSATTHTASPDPADEGQEVEERERERSSASSTLQSTPEGVEGPIHKRLYATFESHRAMWLRCEADKRGYGDLSWRRQRAHLETPTGVLPQGRGLHRLVPRHYLWSGGPSTRKGRRSCWPGLDVRRGYCVTGRQARSSTSSDADARRLLRRVQGRRGSDSAWTRPPSLSSTTAGA